MATQSAMTSAPLSTRLECPPILLIKGSGADKTVNYAKRHHLIADITIIPLRRIVISVNLLVCSCCVNTAAPSDDLLQLFNKTAYTHLTHLKTQTCRPL